MPEKYSITIKNQITMVEFVERPGLEDLCKAIDVVSKNYQRSRRLWNLSKGWTLTDSDVRCSAERANVRFLKPSKAAIIVPAQRKLEFERVFEVFRADDFTENRVFQSVTEALTWLEE